MFSVNYFRKDTHMEFYLTDFFVSGYIATPKFDTNSSIVSGSLANLELYLPLPNALGSPAQPEFDRVSSMISATNV